jgi:tetratricopeptide (TPR) repeat protein
MPIPPDSHNPRPASTKKAEFSLRRFMTRGGRDHLWAFLDYLDERRALKRTLLIGLPAFVIATAFGVWGYQHWARNNAVRIARQWLDAGRLDRAGEAIQNALVTEPEVPASWRLASELAWRLGNRAASVEYAQKAAIVSRYQADDVLAWADASILSDDAEEALEAESFLDPTARSSPRALRLAGEIARRMQLFADSRDQFQAALQADTAAGAPSLAIDEIPLGIVCLQIGSSADRTLGQRLLARWAPDPAWGIALRALLADAVAHRDREAALRWAEALRVHPRCTLGDIPACLHAFADFAPARFKAVLSPLEEKSRASAPEAAQLLGWLTQIGQGAEAIRWGESLDHAIAGKPPIAQGMAEALRVTHRWGDLLAWVEQAEWGSDQGFLGSAYHMVAARQLGDNSTADSLRRSLLVDGSLNPPHALFLGDSLYGWGYPQEATDLLWAAAQRPDLAYLAIGSLVRLYQVQHDAVGQYKAFARLSAMRPSDRKIANNFAYFAALTDLGSQTHVVRIAEDNFNHEPGNVTFRSTYAFVLVWAGQGSKALALMQPVSRDWKKSSAVAFAYGSALASVGRKAEAREVFDSLSLRNLGKQETDWIRLALQ